MLRENKQLIHGSCIPEREGQDITAAQDSDLNPGAPIDLEKAASLTFQKCNILRALSAPVLSLNPFSTTAKEGRSSKDENLTVL